MPLYICSYVLQIVLQIVFHCFTVFTCLYLQKKVWLIVMASGAMAHLGTVAMLCAQAAEVKDQVEACPGPTFDHTRNNLKTTPTSEFEIFKKKRSQNLGESRKPPIHWQFSLFHQFNLRSSQRFMILLRSLGCCAFCRNWNTAVATSAFSGFLSGCHDRKSDLHSYQPRHWQITLWGQAKFGISERNQDAIK